MLARKLFVVFALGATAPVAAQLGVVQSQGWSAAHPELDSEAEAGAAFGHALAAGDFDGDGFDDLAIGIPRRTVSFNANAGEVLVLYGSPAGLAADGHQLWTQDAPGVSDAAEVGDFLGTALAAGDFDGDGFDDLAIGVPGEGLAGFDDAGAVLVLPGGPLGLSADGDLFFHQNTLGVDDAAEAGDRLGFSLAAGDLDDDGDDDLAIGAPDEDLEGVPAHADLGALHVLFGTPSGLDVVGTRFYRPGEGTFDSIVREDGLFFAAALTAGRISGTVAYQVAIGMPGATVGAATEAGAVTYLINPAAGGISGAHVTQDSLGTPGVAETGDRFGAALAIGRFDGEFAGALVVGSPGEDWEPAAAVDAGVFHVFDELPSGSFAATLWTQEEVPPLASEPGDAFGSAFAVGDFDADGFEDLAIGIPGEDVGGGVDFGSGLVLYGSAAGLVPTDAQILPLGVVKVEPDLDLGWSLVAGRFSGHSAADLAISLPRADIDGQANAGAVLVYASIALFLDGFESGDTSEWSSVSP